MFEINSAYWRGNRWFDKLLKLDNSEYGQMRQSISLPERLNKKKQYCHRESSETTISGFRFSRKRKYCLLE
jgi:hypothetical protein